MIKHLQSRSLRSRYLSGWFYALTGLFVAANSWLITREVYLLPLLPLIILILFAALVALDKLVYFIVFFTPLSLTVEFSEFAALTLPTEPLLFGVMLVFFYRILFQGGFDRRITRHPVTVIIIIQLVWMGLTSLTSTMPLISLKYTLARTWFVISFYFIATQIFRSTKNIRFWIWLFTVPLSIVIVYSIVQFYNYNIDKDALYWVMQPFFKDHTIYGAVIAMMLPVMFIFSFDKSYTPRYRFVSFAFFTVILIGIIVSYSRAAWLSVAGAYLVYLMFLLRINWRIVLGGAVLLLSLLFYYSSDIMMQIQRNKQSSSKDLGEHLQSMSNIKNDASNLERINRWNSALRMYKKKPLLGFGPGTYRFQYAPYQRSYEQTYVSTNAGSLGNAHSEYLGPLSESGLPGLFCFLALMIYTIRTAARLYYTARSNEIKYLSIGLLTGLLTYFIHGFLNNFLDQDKASVPFWSMIAMIVALDVYHNRRGKSENAETLVQPPAKP